MYVKGLAQSPIRSKESEYGNYYPGSTSKMDTKSKVQG